jgi:hypothetical protein
MTETRFRQAFLLLLVTAISGAFVAMIGAFLLTILLAAFAGLSYPVYEWILGRLRGRKALAAIATLLLLLVLVMAPLLAVLGAGANEALRVTETIRPRLQQLVDQPGEFDSRFRALPGYDRIEPYRADRHSPVLRTQNPRNRPDYAASRMSQLRKSSSAASHPLRHCQSITCRPSQIAVSNFHQRKSLI